MVSLGNDEMSVYDIAWLIINIFSFPFVFFILFLVFITPSLLAWALGPHAGEA